MTNSDIIVTAGGVIAPSQPGTVASSSSAAAEINGAASEPHKVYPTVVNHRPTTSNGVTIDKQKRPEEYVQAGVWEFEFVNYALGHQRVPNGLGNGDTRKQRSGKVFKCIADSEYKCFESHDGTVYWPGDYVYVETSATEPYMIGSITSFRPNKRDQVSFKVSRYYRPDDIPEVTHSLLVQERKEHGIYEKSLAFESRELFQSDVPSQAFPVSFLRGKCTVKNYPTIFDLVKSSLSDKDTFFSCLSYNIENNRLAAFHLTSRIASRYQADLPDWTASSVSEEPDRDQLLYRPGDICEETELDYIKECRAYRTFLFQSNPRITQLERDSRLGDLVMDDAIVTLHNHGYNVEKSREIMKQQDGLLAKDVIFLTSEDAKKFSKGIRTHGKNFSKIRKEFLPLHSRESLVNFYYMWKKSRDAIKPKALPRTRLVPKKVLKNGAPPRAQSCDLIDYASASESELDDIEERACHHCYGTKSKDWHHAGSNRQLMCTDCRLYYKKYGIMRTVERPATVPLCLSRASPTDEMGVRTRANGKHRKERNIDSPAGVEGEKQSRKSRKRIHRHSAMSDDLLEAPSPSRRADTPSNNTVKRRPNSEPKDTEGSGSEKAKQDNISGSSTAASSPSPKGDTMEAEPEVSTAPTGVKIKEEVPEVKNEPAETSSIVKVEKENVPRYFIKEEVDEGDNACLNSEQITYMTQLNEKDTDHHCALLVRSERKEGERREIFDADNKQFSLHDPVILERVITRQSGNSCARRDIIYRAELNPQWLIKRKQREERKAREQEAKQRREEEERRFKAASATPASIGPPQIKLEINGFNGPDINALQRIQLGAIPPLPMMTNMDPRIILQHHHQQHQAQQQAQLMAMIEQHSKMQQQQQQQQAALAEARMQEQRRQQALQQQQQQAAAAAAAAAAQKQAEAARHQQELQQKQQQHQQHQQQQQQQQQQNPGMPPANIINHLLMMNPMLAGNPQQLNLMASLWQSQQNQMQAQLQAQAEFQENQRKRLAELEMQQRMAQAQRAQAEAAQQAAQVSAAQGNHTAAAALSNLANQAMLNGNPESYILALMQQHQHQQQAQQQHQHQQQQPHPSLLLQNPINFADVLRKMSDIQRPV